MPSPQAGGGLCTPLPAVPVLSRPLQLLLQPRQSLDIAVHRLKTAFARLLEQRRHGLAGIASRVADLNPMSVFSRGFTLVRDEKGIIKSTSQLMPGKGVVIQFQDGQAQATILAVGGLEDGKGNEI
ncbi:MAG: exodeoxyribonuclease VII large subunit [Bacillota bacterium]